MRLGRLVNKFLGQVGLKLARVKKNRNMSVPVFDPTTSYMVSPHLQENLAAELAAIAHTWCTSVADLSGRSLVEFQIFTKDFLNVYANRPFLDNSGGSGFQNSFWNYVLARLLDPK